MTPHFSRWLYYAANKLGGRDVERELAALRQSESLPAAQLVELQWQRLQAVLHCAYEHAPFYRQRFKALGLVPADIKTPADMGKIPITEKSDLRAHYPTFINPTYRGRVYQYGSSGSTGEPVLLRQATTALTAYSAAKLRGHAWHGLQAGTPEGKVWGTPLTGQARLTVPLRNRALNRVQLSAFHATERSMLRGFARMQRRGVQYLYGYSSSIYDFSRLLAAAGVDPGALAPRVIIATSDMLLEDQKNFLESYWDCPAVKEYGAGETGIIAFECEQRNLHIAQENVFIEVVDGDGTPLSGTSRGEVIVTPLRNLAMPLLRYRLHDVAELADGTCSCGRHLPLLANIHGRDSDIVYTPDGRHLHSEVFNHINRRLMDQGQEIRYFQLVQHSLDRFQLLVVPGDRGQSNLFAQGICELLGDVECKVEVVADIPRTASGKIRYVVSHLSADERSSQWSATNNR